MTLCLCQSRWTNLDNFIKYCQSQINNHCNISENFYVINFSHKSSLVPVYQFFFHNAV